MDTRKDADAHDRGQSEPHLLLDTPGLEKTLKSGAFAGQTAVRGHLGNIGLALPKRCVEGPRSRLPDDNLYHVGLAILYQHSLRRIAVVIKTHRQDWTSP